MKDCLYLVIGATVYEAGLDGSNVRLSSDFERASSMTRAGADLFLLEGVTLYRLSPETRQYSVLSRGWKAEGILGSAGDRVFEFEATTLYEALPDGNYAPRIGHMGGTTLLAGSDSRLFSLEDGMLQELFFDDQSYRVVCEARDAVCIAASAEFIYYMSDDGEIFEVEPSSGEGRTISHGWGKPKGLAFIDGKLIVLDGATLCHAKLDGSFDVISRGWENARLMTKR